MQSHALTLSSIPSQFELVLAERKKTIAETNYQGNLKQGVSSVGGLIKITPYSFSDSLRYLARSLSGIEITNECSLDAPIGKKHPLHSVGVRTADLMDTANLSETPINVLFLGDMMVSESGKSIQLDDNFLEKLVHADALVINIESPITFEEKSEGRTGLIFSMAKSYLAETVAQIKTKNNRTTIVYNIANNHSLDLIETTREKLSPKEKALWDLDKENFALLRTIAAIREIDYQGIIIGAHFSEDIYKDISIPGYFETINASVDPIAILIKENLRIGIVGFTDLMNANQDHVFCRVTRTEDLPSCSQLKSTYQLNRIYVFGHGGHEQKRNLTKQWRNLSVRLLNEGADGFIGHGPHVTQTSEVLTIQNENKFIIHSIGNFFGPKMLSNTGINSLISLQVSREQVHFDIQAIEATVDIDGIPRVRILSHMRFSKYAKAAALYQAQYPIPYYSARNHQTPSTSGTFNKVVNSYDTTRILFLDGEEGSVACRVHGSLIANPLPSLSPGHSVETSLRSRLRLNNLTAVRGIPGEGMIGPGDYYGNWEKPHLFTYTISIDNGLPLIHQHQNQTAFTLTTREIQQGETTEVKANWLSATNKENLQRKKSEYDDSDQPLFGNSLFKNAGILEIAELETIQLKSIEETDIDLSPFQARLVRNDIPFKITSDKMSPPDDLRAVSYYFDIAYAKRQIEHGGGVFLETHNFAQSMTPLDQGTGGYVMLGKWKDDNVHEQLEMIGIPIPFGYTLIIDEGCIHGDVTLSGTYMMCMTSNHTTMNTADTVFLKNAENKKNISVSLEKEEKHPASNLETQKLASKPIALYKGNQNIEEVHQKMKAFSIMFNPLSSGWCDYTKHRALSFLSFRKPSLPEEKSMDYSPEILKQKIDCFENIYLYLLEEQNAFFMTNFLNSLKEKTYQEKYQIIQDHLKKGENTRTFKAWSLAEHYYAEYTQAGEAQEKYSLK